MSILPIHLFGSDALRQKAKSVKALDIETIKLIHDMFETMSKANGIGLAATQVGVMKRVIVIDITGTDEESDENTPGPEVSKADKEPEKSIPKRYTLINPEILEVSGSWTMEEGCLSIPDVRADVQRAEIIRVRFRNANFEEVEMEADGLLGRVMLHEIDHLDGVLFIDHVSKAKRTLLRSKLRKIKEGEIETSYPVLASLSPRRRGRVEV